MRQATAADEGLERDAEALYGGLRELMRIYQFRDRDRICRHDLSVTQCHALDVLARDGALALNDLAARLFLDKSTASRVVDALELKELAWRGRDPEDARALRVAATARGRRLADRIAREIREGEMRLLADFDPTVRRATIELVGRLAVAAAARVERSGGSCCSLE